MKGLAIKILLLVNYMLSILYMGKLTFGQPFILIQGYVPLLLATLFLIDAAYIASCNIKGSTILFMFCGLLAIDSWYLLLVSKPIGGADKFFRLLSPVIIFASIKFCLLFVFQGYKYRLKKAADCLLMGLCIGAVFGLFFSDRIYACTFGLQFVVSILCFLSVCLYHWKRVCFFLKNEGKIIIVSFAISLLGFFIYYAATLGIQDHIGNFGAYIVVLVFSISIHGIVLKESKDIPLSAVFTFWQQASFLILGIGFLYLICITLNFSFGVFIVFVNTLFAFIFLFNVILGENLKYENNNRIHNSKYIFYLHQLQQEEQLKAEFAAFLHDEVLQDLLSVKNMTSKSHRPEVQDIIYETLDNLNIHIRNQMQDYHPVILKNLTMKENLVHLIESISSIFCQQEVKVSFECSDKLFLAEPYDILVYRLIKELLTNIYKHSDGNHAWIVLSVEKDIILLRVSDNGSKKVLFETKEIPNNMSHKGILTIKEQIIKLGGKIEFTENIPQGTRIEIEILMKGADSYKYFIN